MARFELAQLDDKMGKPDAGQPKTYQDLIAKPTILVPKPIVMLALADLLWRLKNPTEAAKLYAAKLKPDYPRYGHIAEQADQELRASARQQS